MRRFLLAVGLAMAAGAAAGGCGGAATHAWQESALPTHDRERAFNAALEVFEKHFEVARSNYTAGTIETKPQAVAKRRWGTLADVRGAGGSWRQTAFFEMDRDELAVVGRVTVRLEREATAAAEAIVAARADDRQSELPKAGPPQVRPHAEGDEVWVEAGYDAALARELLSEIAEQAGQVERGEAVPQGESPKEAAEESRRIGAEERP